MDVKLVQNHLLKRLSFYLLHRNVTFGIVQVTVYMSACSDPLVHSISFYSDPLVHWSSLLLLSFSVMSNSLRPHELQASLSFTISRRLHKLMSIESMMSSNHLILCRLLLLLPSIFPRIRVFFNESALGIRWPKYWSFSFSISPSNEYSKLISFRTDWFDLLADQGTLKSLHQHQNLKASVLQCSAFFMGQLSHPYMTTGKTIALTTHTFVGKLVRLHVIMPL